MLDLISQFIEKHHLLKSGDKVLIAVSGGLDSMVLWSILHKLGYQTGVAHANFQLRGKESDEDQMFVESQAKKYKSRLHMKAFDTDLARSKKKQSTQMAARELRYNWFEEICESYAYDAIATAHHLQDSLETALYNLAKGTGPRGLKGISESSGLVVRPLLGVNREQIIQYAQESNIKWREDSSNKTRKYSRNFIRHEIIPLLEELNPSLIATFQNTSLRMQEADDLMKAKANAISNDFLIENRKQVELDLSWTQSGSLPVNSILFEILRPYKASFELVLQLVKSIQKTGSHFSNDKFRFFIDRMKLIIKPVSKENSGEKVYALSANEGELTTPDFVLSAVASKDQTLPEDNFEALLDRDKLSFPLIIRRWKKSDRFNPLGMTGTKKVSDLLIDRKVALPDKENVWVVLSGVDICWVAGLQADNRFKITNQSRNFLRLRFQTK